MIATKSTRSKEPTTSSNQQARWVLGATVGASGLAMLDATTVNVALPAIGADLNARVAGLQWTVNAYTPLPAIGSRIVSPTLE